MKIATWNVNGIRARAAQLCEWLQRDRPDVVCLQELKATAAQIPAECTVPDYHAYWHTLKGYSGVSLAKLDFVTKLAAWAGQLHAEGRELLLCGDMNIARAEMDVHPKERKPNAVGQRPEERALFANLLGEHLVDVGRAFDPDNPNLFTWWAPWRNLRARNIGWRLDYLLASPAIAQRATSCVVQADVGTSDHAPVVMTV